MFPDKANLNFAAIADVKGVVGGKKAFWGNVRGLDMSVMGDMAAFEPAVDVAEPKQGRKRH